MTSKRTTTRRGFLLAALGAAGAAALVAAGLLRRGALAATARFRIPMKPFEPERLRDPHDLAG